jgi:hypothetical protein
LVEEGLDGVAGGIGDGGAVKTLTDGVEGQKIVPPVAGLDDQGVEGGEDDVDLVSRQQVVVTCVTGN